MVVLEYIVKDLLLYQIFKSFVIGLVGGWQIEFFNCVYVEVEVFLVELDWNNIVQIYFGIGYFVVFFCNVFMIGLNDLKGGKWCFVSFWYLDFLKNVGVIFVIMCWGLEILQVLKVG